MGLIRTLEESLERIEQFIDEGDFTEAEKSVKKALKRWRTSTELWTLSGEVAFEIGELEAAESCFKEALTHSKVNAFAWVGLGKAYLESGQSSLGLDAILEANRLLTGDGELTYVLAMALDANGEFKAADIAYEEARTLAPEFFYSPYRTTRDDFDSLAQRCFEDIPKDVQNALGRTTIDVFDMPSQAPTGEGEDPFPPLILGCFSGPARGEQSLEDPWSIAFPARIYLFQRNIERACPDREELLRQIQITLLHEIGHYLGLNEDELDERGLG